MNIIPFYGKTNPILSNHFVVEEGFDYKGMTFYSSEQLFLYLKAELFNDESSMYWCLKTTDPKIIKSRMRMIPYFGFESSKWEIEKEFLMHDAMRAKFKVPRLREYLDSTKGSELRESSPRDVYWGTGYGKDRTKNGETRGLNRAGEILMGIRDGECRAQRGQWVNYWKEDNKDKIKHEHTK